MSMTLTETDTHRGLIDVRDMGVTFGANDNKIVAVDNVSLNVQPGEFVSLIGPSGCGKSTLLNTIVGLEPLDGGELLFLNGDHQARRRPLIGYVFQSPRLLPWRTVGENIRLALKGAGIERSAWRERVDRYLELVGLKEYAGQYPLYLSGGQRQRVGLARALAIESDLVLMDEPFASVDELTARQLRQTTRRLCEQLHRTVLFVTHNLPEAAYMSDFVVTLSQRPACLEEIVTNPLPSPRHWGPAVYGFAAELEAKVALKEEEDL
jgi:NitT/TauT family transport system ATP-binding protein